MKFIKEAVFILFVSLSLFSSCKKDELITDSSAKLDFSRDSVLFDTVFTHVGSTTRGFMIYNNHKQRINISNIHLGGGTYSQYRINIDGVAGTSIKDIEILGNDSIYVFVQVTVNPTNQSSPLLIKDSILFQTNGNFQFVYLTAIGQDVYLHKPDHFPTNGLPPYSITGVEHRDTVLPNDKPHLFFGYTVIDSDCKTTIQAGTKLYFHNNAVLWVYRGATLNVAGTHNNEVTFQGDRLETDYKELPGQWGKIWMSSGSKNNVIDWAIMKNGSIGVQVDSLGASGQPMLRITNTIVKNMKAAAIFGSFGSSIISYNCVFANCGQYVAALLGGGKYRFFHCTFANFYNSNPNNGVSSTNSRSTPLLALTNYYLYGNTNYLANLDSAYFGNCILFGELDNELSFDGTTAAPNVALNYYFDSCVLKTSENTSNGVHYNNCLKNQNPLFKDANENNYRLSINSPAIDAGSTLISIASDLNGNLRSGIPDIGAFEYQ